MLIAAINVPIAMSVLLFPFAGLPSGGHYSNRTGAALQSSRFGDPRLDFGLFDAPSCPAPQSHQSKGETAMTSMPYSRRDLLKGAVAVATTVGVGTIAVSRRAHAQAGAAQSGPIGALLRQGGDAKEGPRVVAVAAPRPGLLCERALALPAPAHSP